MSSSINTQYSDKKILFVGCLYKSPTKKKGSFNSYSTICQKTIKLSKELFPHSSFKLHVDETLDKEMIRNFSMLAEVVIHKYPILQNQFGFPLESSAETRRKNSEQLTKCMRLNTLFSKAWVGRYDYCVVLDIHDDFIKTARLICHYISNSSSNYILTTWKSTEPDCPYNSKINKSNHIHYDAGLSICKEPFPLHPDISFEEFCIAKIMRAKDKLCGGVEEILIDGYLNSISFYEKTDQIKKEDHTCDVDDAFYEIKDNKEKAGLKKSKAYKITTINHKPHSLSTNKMMGNSSDIYVCSQNPKVLLKRKRK